MTEFDPYAQPFVVEVENTGTLVEAADPYVVVQPVREVPVSAGVPGADGVPGLAVVLHDTDADVERPDSPLVYWVGSATPSNALWYDLWLEE